MSRVGFPDLEKRKRYMKKRVLCLLLCVALLLPLAVCLTGCDAARTMEELLADLFGGDSHTGNPNGGDPNGGDPNGDPNGGDPNGGDPNEGDSNGGDPNEGDPNEGDPNEGDPNEGDPNEGAPSEGDPNEGDSNGGDPNEGDQDGTPPTSPPAIPKVIFDTDMDTDCDDVGALALILEYVKAGRAELLGAVSDVPSKYAAACCDYICRYYGVTVPVGTIYDSEYSVVETDRYARYRATQANFLKGSRAYNRKFSNLMGKTDVDYPAAATVYRRILAEAEDQSVTVVLVGMPTAIEALFRTKGDSISPLSGIELFRQKVKLVVSEAQAVYPSCYKSSYNYFNDSIGTARFFEQCPVPIHVSGAGGSIIVGSTYSQSFGRDHPVRIAYETFLGGADQGRMSWDLVAAYYAMNPDSEYFRAANHGTILYVAENDYLCWYRGTRRDCRVYLECENVLMEQILEDQTRGLFKDG